MSILTKAEAIEIYLAVEKITTLLKHSIVACSGNGACLHDLYHGAVDIVEGKAIAAAA